MRRSVLTLLLTVLMAASALAQDDSFAELVITAAGDEEFDIATGITTLHDGGTISHRERGIELTSAFIRYLGDEYVETGEAEAEGPFGTVQAGSVYFDLPEDSLHAADGVTYESGNLFVTATELLLYAGDGVVELRGEVESAEPAFRAARLLFDTDSGTVLLFGPYSYDDGLLELSADGEDSLLELTGTDSDGEDAADDGTDFTASSSPAEETLTRFGPWLD